MLNRLKESIHLIKINYSYIQNTICMTTTFNCKSDIYILVNGKAKVNAKNHIQKTLKEYVIQCTHIM